MAIQSPKFYITDDMNPDDGAQWTLINPGGENFKIVDEEEEEEEYSREKLNGKFRFSRTGYDYINTRPLSTTFTVIIVLPGDPVSVNFADWRGEFHKTDCDFIHSEEAIEVTPRTVDAYKAVIDSIAKEFDLIEIQPPLTPLQIKRRAVLQIYVRGADKITNYIDSAFFEELAVNPSSVPSILAGDYRFGYSGRKYFITGGGTGLSPDISGVYIYNEVTFDAIREDGAYRLFFNNFPGTERVEVRELPSTDLVYTGAMNDPIPNIPVEASQGVLLTSVSDANSQCRAGYTDFYSRILTNQTEVNGDATFPVPATDIVESTGVFKRIHQITYTNFLTAEDNNTTGTRWGIFPDGSQHFEGNHYVRPSGAVYYPVLQSDWFDTSFWVEYDTELLSDMDAASEIYTIQHCYKISDVISRILEVIGSSVTHEESAIYSDFLYGAANVIRGVMRTPIIVPISNVLVGDYDEPQQVAKVSLKDILDLYSQALRAKWRIDDANRMIIEHKHFFDNGGSYAGEVIGSDLTGSFEPTTGKAWDTAQNDYKFEKSKMPERFEYGWQGKTSKPFLGYPTDINSPEVEKGNVVKWQIGKFNPDIDLINVGGSEVSKEGFLFVEAILVEKTYQLPFVTVTIDADEEYNLQNGYCSFVWLVPNLHLYSLPASDLTVNRYPATAITVAKRRIQEVDISTSDSVDTLALTTTGLGNGKPFRIEREVFTNKKKINLRHFNE